MMCSDTLPIMHPYPIDIMLNALYRVRRGMVRCGRGGGPSALAQTKFVSHLLFNSKRTRSEMNSSYHKPHNFFLNGRTGRRADLHSYLARRSWSPWSGASVAHRPPNSILAAKATERSYIDRCPLEALNFGKVFSSWPS